MTHTYPSSPASSSSSLEEDAHLLLYFSDRAHQLQVPTLECDSSDNSAGHIKIPTATPTRRATRKYASTLRKLDVLKPTADTSTKVSKSRRSSLKVKAKVSHKDMYTVSGPVTPYQQQILDEVYSEVTAYPNKKWLSIIGGTIRRSSRQVDNWFCNKRSPPRASLANSDGSFKKRKVDVGEHFWYLCQGRKRNGVRLRPEAEYLLLGPLSADSMFARIVSDADARAKASFQQDEREKLLFSGKLTESKLSTI